MFIGQVKQTHWFVYSLETVKQTHWFVYSLETGGFPSCWGGTLVHTSILRRGKDGQGGQGIQSPSHMQSEMIVSARCL